MLSKYISINNLNFEEAWVPEIILNINPFHTESVLKNNPTHYPLEQRPHTFNLQPTLGKKCQI